MRSPRRVGAAARSFCRSTIWPQRAGRASVDLQRVGPLGRRESQMRPPRLVKDAEAHQVLTRGRFAACQRSDTGSLRWCAGTTTAGVRDRALRIGATLAERSRARSGSRARSDDRHPAVRSILVPLGRNGDRRIRRDLRSRGRTQDVQYFRPRRSQNCGIHAASAVNTCQRHSSSSQPARSTSGELDVAAQAAYLSVTPLRGSPRFRPSRKTQVFPVRGLEREEFTGATGLSHAPPGRCCRARCRRRRRLSPI